MPKVIELPGEFRERHGNEFVRIKEGRVELFADGAKIQHHEYYYDADMMIEPPTDPKANLEARRLYQQSKAEIFERAFAGLRKALLGETPLAWKWDEKTLGPPPDDRDGKAALQLLKSWVHRHREAVAVINAEIDALPEVIAARKKAAEMAELDAEIRQRQDKEYSEIKAIEL